MNWFNNSCIICIKQNVRKQHKQIHEETEKTNSAHNVAQINTSKFESLHLKISRTKTTSTLHNFFFNIFPHFLVSKLSSLGAFFLANPLVKTPKFSHFWQKYQEKSTALPFPNKMGRKTGENKNKNVRKKKWKKCSTHF